MIAFWSAAAPLVRGAAFVALELRSVPRTPFAPPACGHVIEPRPPTPALSALEGVRYSAVTSSSDTICCAFRGA